MNPAQLKSLDRQARKLSELVKQKTCNRCNEVSEQLKDGICDSCSWDIEAMREDPGRWQK